MVSKTVIEILDKTLSVVAQVKTPYPLNKEGDIIQYSKELSDFGQCRFRVSAYDTMLGSIGSTTDDILQPHRYHVRIRRNGLTVWQGAIIENSARNKEYIEVTAAEYLWYFGKKLIRRTSADANGTQNIYRIFNSGTIADAVTNIITETIADYQGNHILANMTIGTIENPNYPPNFTDANGVALSGAWNFSTALQLQFDFHTVLYVLKAFGIYTYADFQIDSGLVFNFKKFIGSDRHYDVNFVWGTQGNAVDYNLPRLGQRQANQIVGIATDNNGVVLSNTQSDSASVNTYGLLEAVAAFSDVKSTNYLNARLQAELPFTSTPDETNAIIALDEKAYPLGLYDIGDIVNIKVTNRGVNFDDARRIVGITVKVHNTGREITTIQSNKPLPFQFGNVVS